MGRDGQAHRLNGGARDCRRQAAILFALLFLLSMLRYCAFGFTYFPQLDDYIQYHNYPSNPSFWNLAQAVGLLTSRPLAGVFDYFIWGPMFDHMIVGVALVTAFYVASVLLLRRLLRRYFRVGPLFLVIMCLLPLGMEGLYWMSASTRVVMGLFFASLAGTAFAAWLDTGRWYWGAAYVALQLIPFGFYEQCAVFSMTLVLGMGLLELRRGRKRPLLALWAFGAMVLYFLLIKALAANNPYASRSEIVLPVTPYYWKVFFPQVVKQVAASFLGGGLFTLCKGFVRGLPLAFSLERLPWLVMTVACCGLFVWLSGKSGQGEKEKDTRTGAWLALLAGFLLALAPVTPFFILGNSWMSLRGTVPSFAGAALMVEALLQMLFSSPARWKKVSAVLSGSLALAFCIAALSEMNDYRLTYENDQQVGRTILATMERDAVDGGLNIGILNVESSSLPDQNFFYHEHIHGCTESNWALSGLLTAMGGKGLPSITPLPTAPMYQRWNSQSSRPDSFDLLYYYDGDQLLPVSLEQTGEHSFLVYGPDDVFLGSIWEDEGENGYFDHA